MTGSRYAPGTKAWGLCARCGLRFFLRELQFDGYYPGLRVCEGCYDSKQPQEFLIDVTDPIALWKPSPEFSPGAPVLSGILVANQPHLAWTPVVLRGGPRVDAYAVYRADSTDGVIFSAFALLASFPVLYYGDAGQESLADLVDHGNPFADNEGVSSQTLTYVDAAVSASHTYQYQVLGVLRQDNA